MKKVGAAIAFIILGLLVSINRDKIFNYLILNFSFSWVSGDIFTRIASMFFISLGLYLIFGILTKRWKLFFSLLAIGVGFGVSFALSPIYVDDYGIIQSENKKLDFELINKHFPSLTEDNESIVLCFFTSTCPFCKSNAQSFQINKKYRKQPKTVILFPSTKEDAKDFLTQTETNFEYALISDEEFIENAGLRFPSVFLIKNGNVENHWIGSEINYSVLDYLRDLAD